MEDNKSQIPVTTPDEGPEQTAPAAPQSVMDVTPPPHDAAPEESMPSLAAEPVAEPPVAAESPVASEPAVAVEPAAAPTTEDSSIHPEDTNIAPAVVNPTGTEQAPVAPAKVKKGGKGMMIAIAVVLALVLASAAVLYYLRSKDNKQAVKTPTTSSTVAKTPTTPAATPVSGTDVDAASKNVDTTISSLDENADFGSTALSDKSLGLQ